MYGLLMMKIYADQILNGEKHEDARLYPTEKRGTIALVDSMSFKILGTADLVRVDRIPYEEFVSWHRVGPFKDTLIAPYAEGRTCFAYRLENVRRLLVPVKLPRNPDAKVWVTVPERTARSLHSQTTLF